MTNRETIAPCPFCGGTDIDFTLLRGHKRKARECHDCGARGPVVPHEMKREPINETTRLPTERWNTRSPVALHGDGVVERVAKEIYCAYEGIRYEDNVAHVEYWFDPKQCEPDDNTCIAEEYAEIARRAIAAIPIAPVAPVVEEQKPRFQISPEWCERMAELEDGYEVGAGMMAMDPLCPPPRDPRLAIAEEALRVIALDRGSHMGEYHADCQQRARQALDAIGGEG